MTGIYSSGMYKAVEKAGSVSKLAGLLGVKRQAVYPWLVRGYAPLPRAVQIEEMFGIPRDELMDPALKNALGGAAAEVSEVGYQPRAKPLW